MGKKVLLLSASPRKNGNSSALADAFLRGAAEAGNETEKIELSGKQIGFCRGCLACHDTSRCVIRDDADEIAQKMRRADVIAFATPVYYYCVSGQLKTMLDRANPLYGSDYAFRSVYLLLTAADDAPSAADGSVKAVQGWVDCFERASLCGCVFAGGVEGVGDIAGHSALAEAYALGKGV